MDTEQQQVETEEQPETEQQQQATEQEQEQEQQTTQQDISMGVARKQTGSQQNKDNPRFNFDHELFWDYFYREATNLIRNDQPPRLFVVTKSKSQKLLESARQRFGGETVPDDMKNPEELVFTFQKPAPEGEEQENQPKFAVQVLASDVIQDREDADVGVFI